MDNAKTLALFVCGYLLVCCVVADFAEEYPKHREAVEKCMAEFNIAPEDVKNLFHMPSEDTKRTRSCLKACVLQYEGTMNGTRLDTDVLCEKVKTHLPNADIDSICKAASDCAEEVKALVDKCEVVDKFDECFRAKLPEEVRLYREKLHDRMSSRNQGSQGGEST